MNEFNLDSAWSPICSLDMSSRDIAVVTGKRHDNVMRDIEKMLAELELNRKEYSRQYLDPQNKQAYAEYLLTGDLTLNLLTGYSTGMRQELIERIESLEQQISRLSHPSRR